jgi:hypothetical protein
MTAPRAARQRTAKIAVALVAGLALGAGAGLPAHAASNRIDLKVLVVDDGTPWVGAIADELQLEGVPHTTIHLTDPNRAAITASTLSSGTEAYYQAVVLPSTTSSLLGAAELTALSTYEATFGIRQVDAYVYPGATVGMNSPTYSGDFLGFTASATPAGLADGFGYFTGSLTFQGGSYGYLATPMAASALPAGATFTPLVSVANPTGSSTGVLLGHYAAGGLDQLVITAAFNSGLQQFRVLAHGIVSWATKGMHLGYNRNYFTFNFDDAFAADSLWDPAHKCTPGEDCPRDKNGDSIYPESLRGGLAEGAQLHDHDGLQRLLRRRGGRSADPVHGGQAGIVPLDQPWPPAPLPGLYPGLHHHPLDLFQGRLW